MFANYVNLRITLGFGYLFCRVMLCLDPNSHDLISIIEPIYEKKEFIFSGLFRCLEFNLRINIKVIEYPLNHDHKSHVKSIH